MILFMTMMIMIVVNMLIMMMVNHMILNENILGKLLLKGSSTKTSHLEIGLKVTVIWLREVEDTPTPRSAAP